MANDALYSFFRTSFLFLLLPVEAVAGQEGGGHPFPKFPHHHLTLLIGNHGWMGVSPFHSPGPSVPAIPSSAPGKARQQLSPVLLPLDTDLPPLPSFQTWCSCCRPPDKQVKKVGCLKKAFMVAIHFGWDVYRGNTHPRRAKISATGGFPRRVGGIRCQFFFLDRSWAAPLCHSIQPFPKPFHRWMDTQE